MLVFECVGGAAKSECYLHQRPLPEDYSEWGTRAFLDWRAHEFLVVCADEGVGLEFGEDQADAAYDVVGRGFVGGEREELDGEVSGVGAEDETAFVEVDEAEEEGGTAANGIEGGLMGPVGSERVVVAVEDGDCPGGDERVHGGGLLGVGADGEEALPLGVGGGGADAVGVIAVEAGGGDLDGFDNSRWRDAGLVHGGRGRDDGDDFDRVAGVGGDGGLGCGEVDGENLIDGEVLRGEDAIEAFEGEGAFAVEEIRDMGLAE
ncbi:MAG: hypothetical protein JWQ49_5986 [Edaphobacter sp.]|nr:hypothetical protein [Edaphobacter sp.]